MTVTAGTSNRASEVGNGVKVAFDFTFRIFAASELNVFKVVTTTQVQTLQTLTTDYTVAINGVDNSLTTPGGTVTYTVAPTATETSLIISNYTLDQQTDIPTASNIPEEALEDGFDKGILIAIQQQEELARSAKLPEATTVTDLSLPIPTANRALVWNGTADALINSTDEFNDIVTNATTQATNAANSASAASSSASNAATSASNASTSETNAAASAASAQAAVGGVRISDDDTTADDLETKLLAGAALTATTQNPGGNETRTINVDINSASSETIATGDEILFGDITDSNNVKRTTVNGLLGANGTASFVQLDVDNIRVDGNTISSTDTNGDINLDPDGAGNVAVSSGNFSVGSGEVYIGATTGTDTLEVSAANSQFRMIDTDDSNFCQMSYSTSRLAIRNNSTSANHVFIESSGGITVGNPTGGDKGIGTINAQSVFDDNVLLTCYVFDQYVDGAIDDKKWDGLSGKLDLHEPMRKFKSRIGGEYDPLDIDKYAKHFKDKKHLTSMPNIAKFDAENNMGMGKWVQRLIETVEIQAIHISELNERVKTLEGAIKNGN